MPNTNEQAKRGKALIELSRIFSELQEPIDFNSEEKHDPDCTCGSLEGCD